MAERIEIASGLKVRRVGIIDLGDFYRDLKRWFDFNGYADEGSGGKKFDELSYKETKMPGGALKIELVWEGRKEETPFITYVISIVWLLIAVTDVEVVIDNKKLKKQKGDFELRISSYIDKHYTEKRGLFKSLFEKFIAKKTIEDHKREVYDKTYSLQSYIKEYFDQYMQ
ncbi:MAG: hypothetical protein PHE43_02395 [Candidatus Nanoarchaeia archaeon]|nr:hypothetical protein [Candidatus Nanoarchaeia archaeon]